MEQTNNKKNIHKGKRYVPKHDSVWDINKNYESLTVVLWEGSSYTTRKNTPAGVDIHNEEYWALSANFNGQIEQYRQDVNDVKSDYANLSDKVDTTISDVNTIIDDFESDINTTIDDFESELATRLPYVNYEMFRDVGDTDDEVITKTHTYANENNVPVINVKGEYTFTDRPRNIEIKTDVYWGDTIFHVDESKNLEWFHYFKVVENEQTIDISDSVLKTSIIEKLNNNEMVISELATYENSLLFINDDNDRVGGRHGFNSNWSKRDFFYIGFGGRIVGDKLYNFANATEMTIQPLSSKRLTIKGGHFIGNGLTSVTTKNVFGAIGVYRSFVDLDNQSFSSLKTNTNENAVKGDVYIHNVYDVKLMNSLIKPRYAKDSVGTYGISGSNILKLTIDNVNTLTDTVAWGVMGANFIKDLKVVNSKISRIDVHYQLHNAIIQDVETDRVSITGGGYLYMDNVTVNNNEQYVAFRNDYGAKWDGKIQIENGVFNVLKSTPLVKILQFSNIRNDFNYIDELSVGSEIIINDFKFNFKDSESERDTRLIDLPSFAESAFHKIKFPSLIEIKNVTTNRSKGVTLMIMPSNKYQMANKNNISSDYMIHNATMFFENIQTDERIFDGKISSNYNTILGLADIKDLTLNDYDLLPKITMKNLPYVTVKLHKNYGLLFIEDCLIDGIGNASIIDGVSNSITKIKNSCIRGNLVDAHIFIKGFSSENSLRYYKYNTLENTILETPIVNGVLSAENFVNNNLITNTDYITGNHINTRIDSTLQASINLSEEVLNKLLSNYYI